MKKVKTFKQHLVDKLKSDEYDTEMAAHYGRRRVVAGKKDKYQRKEKHRKSWKDKPYDD